MKLFLLLLFSLPLFSYNIAEYKVTYGLFGKVGKSTVRIDRDEKSYKITTIAKAEGFAAWLSNHRVEVMESKGRVVNGELIPDTYSEKRTDDKKYDLRLYTFDHNKKEIRKTKCKKINQCKNLGKLPYYAKEDLVSLYFNLAGHFKGLKKETPYNFYAVGGRKKDGLVTIMETDDKQVKKKLKSNEGNFFKVFVYQKIFSSKKGEMLLNLLPNGFTNVSLLKDVLLFGDIKIKLLKLR